MSNRSKGNAFELKIKKYLEANGFTVDKARAIQRMLFLPGGRKMFVSSPNDFFGVADLIGVHHDKDYTLFVQCCAGTTKNLSVRRHKLEAVRWNFKVQRVQLWSKPPKRGMVRVDELCAGLVWTSEQFKPAAGEGAPSAVL